MKKSVLMIIGLIYIFAVVLVGVNIKSHIYNPVTYVNEIEVLNEEYVPYTDENRYEDYDGSIITKYEKGLKIELKCKAKPYDATDVDLTYIYDKNSEICSVEETKEDTLVLSFNMGGIFPVTVRPTDGSNVELSIFIKAKRKAII